MDEARGKASVADFRGQSAARLVAGDVEATFLPGLGMLGASLRFAGREHLSLHGGLGAFRSGHTTGLPLLAPWANRLGGPRYRVGSHRVDLTGVHGLHTDAAGLPMHGTMLGQRRWEVVHLEWDASQACASLLACFRYEGEALLAAFPFPHEIEVLASVTPEGLAVSTTIRPIGRRSAPISFGWHPYFRIPGVRRRSELTLELPAMRRLHTDERQIPDGRESAERAQVVGLGGVAFDTGYRLGRTRRFRLSSTERSLIVEMDSGYSFAQVFAPGGKPYVAIEPMTAPANALLTGEHPVVGPGESFTATFTVQVRTKE